MTLTNEQQQAMDRGEAVLITLDGRECVVMTREVYDRVKQVIYDDSTWSPEERKAVLAAFGEKAGWDDPELDIYEQYRP